MRERHDEQQRDAEDRAGVCCQPTVSISTLPMGGNRNWPEGAGRRARAEGEPAPLLRQQLAEGAEHEVERAARQAEADQHAGAERHHAGRASR